MSRAGSPRPQWRYLEQPGFVGGYHAQDSETGTIMSIIAWDSAEGLSSLKDRTPPGGPIGMKPVSVEVFDVVEGFGWAA